MNVLLAELVHQFDLEQMDLNLFRGASRDLGSPQVFGGQVLGQALMAACATVEPGRRAHSLHGYFLLRGDVTMPIVYQVDRSRDGYSFTTRRVTAIQHGRPIFHMSASFQVEQVGFEHQHAMPAVPDPETLGDSAQAAASSSDTPARIRRFLSRRRPFEFRPCPALVGPGMPEQAVWIRAIDRLPDEDALHRSLLAYVSDYLLLMTATLRHAEAFESQNSMMASLDHAMWFHRPMRVDEWFLYATDSPSASGARGFARGSIYARDGSLVASTAQEGLMRPTTHHRDGSGS